MNKKKRAIVVIPTYNERENIAALVPVLMELAGKIKSWQLEVLVVDDTSPDKTYEVVRDLQNKYPLLHLFLNKEKAGLGGAYLKGITYAFEKLGADAIFEFDADFSHDPQKIPEFLAKLDEGYDFVIGGRYKDGGSIDPDWPLLRKFYSVVGNLVIMLVLTDFRIRDWTSGYRAIKKEIFLKVAPELKGGRFSGYTWQIGLLNKARGAGAKITEVPINFIDRKIGESKLGTEYIKNTLLYIFQVRLEEIMHARVLKFLAVGGLGALIQFVAFNLIRQITGEVAATPIATEIAIISNFIFNNSWTFRDKKIEPSKIGPQFLKFNLSSLGSLIIQFIVMSIGMWALPNLHIWRIDAGNIYTAMGILLGMIWNFFAYNTFIWKANAKKNLRAS